MTPEEISGLFETNGLSLTRTQTEANPFMPGDKDGLDHYYCVLSGGGIETFEFYFSHTPDLSPSDEELVGVLMTDIKAYRGCSGYEDFLRVFKLTDDEDRADVALAWDELGRLAPLMDQVLELANGAAPLPTPAPGM